LCVHSFDTLPMGDNEADSLAGSPDILFKDCLGG